MSATTKAARQRNASSKAAKTAPKRARKQPEPTPEVTAEEQRRAAISAGMRELSEARKEAREARNGKPAKWCVWDDFYKAVQAKKELNIEATAKKYQDVKESTIRAWANRWKTGGPYPSNATEQQKKQLPLLLKKLAA